MAVQIGLAATALVGFFAILHGYAHSVETPERASSLLHGLGFVGTTALLRALGVGLAIGRRQLADLRRGSPIDLC